MNKEIYSDNTLKYIACYENILNRMRDEMTNASLSCSLSSDFINQMIPHHRGAIQMSQNLLTYTTNTALQNIAKNIMTTQMQGIHDLMNIHYQCTLISNNPDEIQKYFDHYEHISEAMFHKMKCAKINNDINIDFIKEMLPHHEGAIEMAQNIARFDICPALVPIVENIISTQQLGIQKLKDCLHQIDSTKY